MKVLITGGMGVIGAESSRKRQAHAPTIGAEIKRNIKSGAATENLSFEHELLHHLPDLLGHRLRQPQGCADDFIDLFPGSAGSRFSVAAAINLTFPALACCSTLDKLSNMTETSLPNSPFKAGAAPR